jgi:hypothetical protein
MVIDEISMIDLKTLTKINDKCKTARALKTESSELFGGLPLVIVMGAPIKGLPLWRIPDDKKDKELTGRKIWLQFTHGF